MRYGPGPLCNETTDMREPPEFDMSPRQRGRREGAGIVVGWVILGMLPTSVIAMIADDPFFAVWATTAWTWVVAAVAGTYVSFSRPSE